MTVQKFVQFIRAGDWWIYKLAPILASGMATASVMGLSLFTLWPALLLILAVITLVAVFASLINDYCDMGEDLIAGKPNQMVGRTRQQVVTSFAFCITIGILITAVLPRSPSLFCLYLASWIVFAVYSMPPIRLKNRGWLGVVAIALGECLFPHLIAALLIKHEAGLILPKLWLMVLGVWSVMVGLRSILWHQLKDSENDLSAGLHTAATSTKKQRVLFIGKAFVFPVECSAFAVMLWMINQPIIWILLLVYLATEILRATCWQQGAVIVEPRPNDRLLMLEYYDSFYPLALIIAGAIADPRSLAILGLFYMCYGKRLRWWWMDITGMIRTLGHRLIGS